MSKLRIKEVTTYDILKTIAVVLMIVDHVGHHFFPYSVEHPEYMWFRVLGRLCVPIWFFLIGYAKTTELSKDLWVGALLVMVSSLISGQYLLPLNILFAIIVMRMCRSFVIIQALKGPEVLRGLFLIIIFLGLPTGILFEYGSIGMLFVMMGFFVRWKSEVVEHISVKHLNIFYICSFFVFYLWQGATLPYMNMEMSLVLAFGLVVIGFSLWRFEGRPLYGLSSGCPVFLKAVLQFTGRHTLAIYVAHVVIFRMICMVLYPDKYSFLDWKLVPPAMLSIFM